MKNNILEILNDLDQSLESKYLSPSVRFDPSLATGHSGVALFYAYYYRFTNNEKHLNICFSLVRKLVQHVSKVDMPSTFCDGLAGIGWLVQHFVANRVFDAEADILEDFDQYLSIAGYHQILNGNYDFLHGGLGCALYLLDRPNSERKLDALLDALYQTKMEDRNGYYWPDKFSWREPNDMRTKVNFGLAHGLPSIIFILSKLIMMKIGGLKAIELLKGTMNFLLYHSISDAKVGSFFLTHCFINSTEDELKSRLAWCYGDLGVLNSLFFASEALSDKKLQDKVIKMAMETTRRRILKDEGIVDGGICHGLAGISQVYLRFFARTNEDIFAKAHNYWIDQLVKSINLEKKGIRSFKEFNGVKNQYFESNGFLAGAIGAGLALLAYVDKKTVPNWDRFMLLS